MWELAKLYEGAGGGEGGISPARMRGDSVHLRECWGGHTPSTVDSCRQLAGTSPSSPRRWHLPSPERRKSKEGSPERG